MTVTVTVTYLRVDVTGQSCVRVGESATIAAAVDACDWQLPRGEWHRIDVSTVSGIQQSLHRNRRGRRSPAEASFEGVSVYQIGPQVMP